MYAEPGQPGRVWGQGAVHGGREPVHPQEQGADDCLPGPPLQRAGEALPGRGPHQGRHGPRPGHGPLHLRESLDRADRDVPPHAVDQDAGDGDRDADQAQVKVHGNAEQLAERGAPPSGGAPSQQDRIADRSLRQRRVPSPDSGRYHRVHLHVFRGLSPNPALHIRLSSEGRGQFISLCLSLTNTGLR